jgi:hypothetical protein
MGVSAVAWGTSGRVTLRRSAIGRPKTIQAIVDKRQHMLMQQRDQLSFSVSSARVRLNLVTCTNCMEDGASHFSI